MSAAAWSALAHTPAATVLTVAIGLVYPLYGWFRFRQLEKRPDPVSRAMKLRLYASVVISQWTLVAAAALVLGAAGLGLDALGLRAGASLARTALVAVALLAGFAVLSRLTLVQLARAASEDLPTHVKRAGRILPRDGVERAGFIPVALTAGVCEEILYRGWLPWALAAWTGSALAGFVLAAIVFGLGHAYQGRNGVALTGLLGLFLGAVVAWTGSLWPAQLLHVAVDLVNGIAVGAALARMPAAGTSALQFPDTPPYPRPHFIPGEEPTSEAPPPS